MKLPRAPGRRFFYSVLRLFAGFASAACMHLKLTVMTATSSVIIPAAAKTVRLMSVRYAGAQYFTYPNFFDLAFGSKGYQSEQTEAGY